MVVSSQEIIGKLLSESIPRELLLNFERLYLAALERAVAIGAGVNEGHRASVVGHNRHFALNEALMSALDECDVQRSRLRGNAALVGKTGIASIGRVHMNRGKWDNSKRSKGKVKLCEPNRKVATLVQLDFFEPADTAIDAITAFLVTQGDGTDGSPAEVFITVPNEEMDFRNPLFVEPLGIFMQRYQQMQEVVDSAQPRLKASIKRDEEIKES
jgi:hypothetical protein